MIDGDSVNSQFSGQVDFISIDTEEAQEAPLFCDGGLMLVPDG